MKCPNCNAQLDEVDTPFVECNWCGTRVATKDSNQNDSGRGLTGMLNNMFQDKDNNGIPDIFESPDGMNVSRTQVSTSVTVNGKEYKSMDEVPEEIKKLLNSFGDKNALSMSQAQSVSTVERQTRAPGRAILFFVAAAAVVGALVFLMMK